MSKYTEALSSLPDNVGSRNAMLLGIVHLGINDGVSPEKIASDIIEAGGEPKLTDAEVGRAIARAMESHQQWAGLSSEEKSIIFARQNAEAASIQCTDEERGYMEKCMMDGRMEAMENDHSPWYMIPIHSPIPYTEFTCPNLNGKDRVKIAKMFIRTLHPNGGAFVFHCKSQKEPRDEKHVTTVDALVESIRTAEDIPELISTNEYSGKRKRVKNANGYTMANSELVVNPRNILLEIDPLSGSYERYTAEICLGIIKDGWPVLSAVTSGNKSIHMILRVPMPNSGDLFGEPTDEDKMREFRKAAKKLVRHSCSSPDAALRCDKACFEPVRMTRVPGAMRGLREGPAKPGEISWGDNYHFQQGKGATAPQMLIYLDKEGN